MRLTEQELPAQGAGPQSENWRAIRADHSTENIHIGRGVISHETQIYNLIKRIQLGEISPEMMECCSISFKSQENSTPTEE